LRKGKKKRSAIAERRCTTGTIDFFHSSITHITIARLGKDETYSIKIENNGLILQVRSCSNLHGLGRFIKHGLSNHNGIIRSHLWLSTFFIQCTYCFFGKF